jgi:hypothetical protein
VQYIQSSNSEALQRPALSKAFIGLQASLELQRLPVDCAAGYTAVSHSQEVERAVLTEQEHRQRHVVILVEHSKYGTPVPPGALLWGKKNQGYTPIFNVLALPEYVLPPFI